MLILSITIVLACLVPFIYLMYRNKKKVKVQQQKLSDIASQHNCHITQLDTCGDFIIGMDADKSVLFFGKGDTATSTQVVELKDYRRVHPIKSYKETTIHELGFTFYPKAGDQKAFEITLYEMEVNYQLKGELQVWEKWDILLTNYFAKRK